MAASNDQGKEGKSKRKGRKSNRRHDGADQPAIDDPRFAAASSRPQFRTKKGGGRRGREGGEASGLLVDGGDRGGTDARVEIDDRFAAALTDPRFRVGGETGKVDKYGRKTRKKDLTNAGGDDMDRFYKLEKKEEGGDAKEDGDNSPSHPDPDSDSDSDSDSGASTSESESAPASASTKSDAEKKSTFTDEDSNNPEARIAYLTALSRGEIYASSDDSSSDDESVGSSDSSHSDSSSHSVEGKAGVLDPSTKETEEEELEITHESSMFLAVCNMDWSQVRAVDIFSILSSFCPPGSVKCVKVYPSDFGMERMEKDAMMGPQGIWKNQRRKKGSSESEGADDDIDDDDDDDDRGKKGDSGGEEKDSPNMDDIYDHFPKNPTDGGTNADSDFDPEKLRAYEASKLKYFFAVAEFTSVGATDAVYKEVDGMEIGHSSTVIDLRSIPTSEIRTVVNGRKVRDECAVVPSSYEPPDYVVVALQQTAVRCTWEDGDADREKRLTQYGVGNETWAAMTEGDDLRAYLASDVSSDEESEEDTKTKKGSKMRALLGLGSGDEEGDGSNSDSSADSDDGFGGARDRDEGKGDTGVKEATFIPGKRDLQDKIRDKIEAKKVGDEEEKELTPWEKYQLKRKEKRKERRKTQRARRKDKLGQEASDDDGMYGVDEEFGVPESDSEDGDKGRSDEDFFLDDEAVPSKKSNKTSNELGQHISTEGDERRPSTKEELELLIAGDDDEEAERDFDMRGIARMEKNKGKKLKGSRKRKEAKKASHVSGVGFKIDTSDRRFAAVLDGSDSRFGIDRTDANFKNTPAMQTVLAEQSKRRKKKRAKLATDVSADALNKANGPTGGALALSSLVKSIKSNVAKTK